MTSRDKKGLVILIALFVLLIVALIWTSNRPAGPAFAPKDSPIIQQRIKNLQRTE